MVDFETSSSTCKSEVSKSHSWKITSFSKTMELQREPLLTMFYTINLSPFLVTKKGVMLIIIFSNYQKCPLPLSRNYTYCKLAGTTMCKSLLLEWWLWEELVWSWRFEQYTLIVFRSRVYRSKRQDHTGSFQSQHTHSWEIYSWLYPQVDYLFIVSSYSPHHAKLQIILMSCLICSIL